MTGIRESCLDTWVASSGNGDGYDVIECNRSRGGTVAVEVVSRRDDGIMTVSHIFLDREAAISLHEWLGRRLSSPVGLVCPPDCPGCGEPMIPNPFLDDWECHGCGWSLLRRM